MTGATDVTGRHAVGSQARGDPVTGNGREPLAGGVSR
jgi:hypothetical protein